MFSKDLDRVLGKRKKAIQSGIPQNFLSLADWEIEKALFCRERPKSDKWSKDPIYREVIHSKMIEAMLVAENIFDAQLTDRFSIYKEILLKGFLKTKGIKRLDRDEGYCSLDLSCIDDLTAFYSLPMEEPLD